MPITWNRLGQLALVKKQVAEIVMRYEKPGVNL
jgi:hypothetical protein